MYSEGARESKDRSNYDAGENRLRKTPIKPHLGFQFLDSLVCFMQLHFEDVNFLKRGREGGRE